jgi:hypothetical protein
VKKPLRLKVVTSSHRAEAPPVILAAPRLATATRPSHVPPPARSRTKEAASTTPASRPQNVAGFRVCGTESSHRRERGLYAERLDGVRRRHHDPSSEPRSFVLYTVMVRPSYRSPGR